MNKSFNIHLSKAEKDKLVSLKRRTKVSQWNILCRWAFCLSLNEDSAPQEIKIIPDSNVEMTWNTFTGECGDLLMAALKVRCLHDNIPLDDETLEKQFRLHLYRGIGYLATQGKVKSIMDMMNLALTSKS